MGTFLVRKAPEGDPKGALEEPFWWPKCFPQLCLSPFKINDWAFEGTSGGQVEDEKGATRNGTERMPADGLGRPEGT